MIILYIDCMNKSDKEKIILSSKRTEEVIGVYVPFDREVETLFRPLTDELDRVIRFTIPYKYGGFRFVVRVGSDGNARLILAEKDWHRKYGNKIRSICNIFNLDIEYDQWAEMYLLIPGDLETKEIEYNGALWLERVKKSRTFNSLKKTTR